ncbi:MAG: DMT family protein [Candidatus Saccharicenans sp.]|nr:DMT family protein [Candidatus Saccharicenans sp.]
MTVGLLLVSKIFMTFGWYGHLKFKSLPLWIAIVLSWLIACLEDCFQVPDNRLSYGRLMTLTVFSFFSVLYLREDFR